MYKQMLPKNVAGIIQPNSSLYIKCKKKFEEDVNKMPQM